MVLPASFVGIMLTGLKCEEMYKRINGLTVGFNSQFSSILAMNPSGAFLMGKFNAKLEIPQGFCWIYNKLGDEMKLRDHEDKPMNEEEIMLEAKEIFQEWIDKNTEEKLQLLSQQKNLKHGSEKVLLQMQRTIYGSVQAARASWMELQKAF
jgi:hypothetical protein